MSTVLCLPFKFDNDNSILSAGLGRQLQLLSISEMGMLHVLPFTFGDWPFGITVTFLNKILFATRTLSNPRRSRNSFGKNSTAYLLETAWQGTLHFLTLLWQILHIYERPSYDKT